MSGKVAKRLRKEARGLTVGQPDFVTKKLYKILKYNYKMDKKFPDNL